MKTKISEQINRYIHNHKKMSIALLVTVLLSAVVLITVVMSMSKPAVSMTESNPYISAEYMSTEYGNSLAVNVKAQGTAEQKCFTLTFNGKCAGLSDEYIFNDDKTEITDNSGNSLVLNREIGGDGAVNYWFELSNGEKRIFTLDCESDVYVVTDFDIQDYKSTMTNSENSEELTDNEIADIIKSQKKSENSNNKTASLTIVGGSGKDLDSAKDDTARQSRTELSWVEKINAQTSVKKLRASSQAEYIDGGEIEGTSLTWAYTKNRMADKGTLTISGSGDLPNDTNLWSKYAKVINTIVIGDDVTSVGSSCFRSLRANNLKLGKSLETIGGYSFDYNNFSEVVFPESLKSIGSWAFQFCSSLTKVTFSEGFETIGGGAFRSCKIKSVYIPSTVKSISFSSNPIEEYIVNENNTTYYSDDGILFKYLSDGTSELVSYPPYKKGDEYIIPENVSSVGASAFSYLKYTKRITVPNTVPKFSKGQEFYGASSLEEVIFGDSVKINSSRAFDNGCTNLKRIVLHENNGSSCFYLAGASSLQELYIAVDTSTIVDYQLSSSTPSLKNLYFDAKHAYYFQSQPVRTEKYELTIGKNVDRLRNEKSAWSNNANGFQSVLKNAETVKFVGPNQITIDEHVFNAVPMPEPLDALVGTVYVDEQGVVYKYDAATLTASVAYVPYDAENIVIPAEITPKSDVTCKINTVDTYAFKLAEKLTSVSFEQPENIENISVYGFAYAQNLASVNGKTTEEEAETSFSNAQIGYRAFVNTALGEISGGGSFSENMNGQKSLVVGDFRPMYISFINNDKDEGLLEWESGGYKTLTGNNISVSISVGNIEQSTESVYRVYFEASELDNLLSIAPGNTIEMNGTTVTCYATEAPNIVYIDFVPNIGQTATISIESTYPSPSSKGGGLTVWGMILTQEQAEENANKIIECPSSVDEQTGTTTLSAIQAYWTTVADDFTLSKSSTGNTTVNIIGDGNGNLILADNISYKVVQKRNSNTTSAYGKDYVRSVEFYDYITLPEQVQWKPEVIENIKSGNTRTSSGYFYAGDISIASISSYNASSFRAEWSEELQNIVFYWKSRNSSTTSEIGNISVGLTLHKGAFDVNSDILNDAAGTLYTVHNDVKSVTHFTYSSDVEDTADVDKYFSPLGASVAIGKSVTTATYFGEDIQYTIRLYNKGAAVYESAEGNYRVSDSMPQTIYIIPENIERMFNDTYGERLTLTITNAIIGQYQKVTATDGTDAYITPANTTYDDAETDSLVISWNDDKTKLQITKLSDGSIVEVDTSLSETLKNMGYAIDLKTTFKAEWGVADSDNKIRLTGGQNNYYYIYATIKDTFMLLNDDYPGSYPTAQMTNIRNYAYLMNGNRNITYDYVTRTYKREAYISKTAYLNETGEKLTDGLNAQFGDVVDYNIEFAHYGTGKYENLPLVDDIFGIQELLVPVENNTSLADENLKIKTIYENGENTEYYILSKPGTYRNIYVGVDESGNTMLADTITVNFADSEETVSAGSEIYSYSGLHTKILWYYSYLEPEAYYLDVSYHTIVDKELLTSSTYTIGNIAWMNNKQNDRIYTNLWGSGSLLASNKEIVTPNPDGTYTADDDGYSVVSNGESVYYRLTLSNPNDYPFTITGNEIVDELPTTINIFDWTKDNVSLFYDDAQSSTISGLDDWQITDQFLGITRSGHYYISWDSSMKIIIPANDSFVMYVRLDFPDNNDDSTLWTEYCDAVKGDKISNILYVYNEEHTVYHSLKEAGSVLIQKGVYGTGRYISDTHYETQSRIYYNNNDSSYRTISYYVILYNNGNSRLYLDDIYDLLPEGFTFNSLVNNAVFPKRDDMVSTVGTRDNSNISQNSLTSVNVPSETEVCYRNANITCTADGRNLTFTVSAGTGEYAVQYDETEDKYFLSRNDALVFGYMCNTGKGSESLDSAKNTLTMHYYDYLDSGVNIADSSDVSVNGKFTYIHTDQNDGSCSVKEAEDVSALFPSATGGQWLTSDVTVIRGGIIPGVTAYTDSYVNDQDTIVMPYKTSVGPYATINWRARLHSSGKMSITDYTFEDKLPAPYSLTGKISLKIYEGSDNNLVSSFADFASVSRKSDDLSSVTITTNVDSYTLNTNGEPVTISFSKSVIYDLSISLTRSEDGQETLRINFSDTVFSIPEDNGYAEITLSSKNYSGIFKNTVYTNYTSLIPNIQNYDSAAQGSLIYDGEDIAGVVNNSPINVSFGYSTSSLKSVHEYGNSDNSARSDSDGKRYIILPNSSTEFTYTLSVKNDTENAMSKLIFIDNLPEPNDHSPFDSESLRESEFKVAFADNTNVTVSVTDTDGNTSVIDEKYYKVEYADKTEFNAQDWTGLSQWGVKNPSSRSIRISIIDSDEQIIHPEATVSVTFNAKIDGEVTAAQIAWNSFGYHYAVSGVELEAMPLSVGVKIPEVPTLQKSLITLKGISHKAESDLDFSFVLYSGSEIDGQFTSYDELAAALENEGRDYKKITLTVNSGSSESEKLKLDFSDWNWINGNEYTITELSPDNDYMLKSWNDRVASSFTFIYDNDTDTSLKCCNVYKLWSFKVEKADSDDKTIKLADAVFAIYSKYPSDLISDDEYSSIQDAPQKTITVDDKEWYLSDVKTTDSNGLLEFSRLPRSEYYLKEIKSPDGYLADMDGRIINNNFDGETIIQTNRTMFELPTTGGNIYFYIVVCLLLTVIPLTVLTVRKIKSKRMR